jgi:uncharacterized membrane protein
MASIYDTATRSGEQQESGQQERHRDINVGRNERNASMASGAALALSGITRIRKGRFLPGLALLTLGGMFLYRGKTGHCSMYEQFGINTAGGADTGIEIEKTVTVNKPPREVYNFWRRLENLPRFMRHLESVQVTGDRTSHWRAKAPTGITVDWDAELLEDNLERIRWRSLENADIPNEGTVEFHQAPAGKGTEVKVHIRYSPPGGTVAKATAKVMNAISAQQVEEDLKRFKQILETGETATSEYTAHHPEPARSFMPGGGAVNVR